MVLRQIRDEQFNSEGGVVGQESTQHVDLIPAPALQNPFFRVLERVEDVMKVDVDAGSKPRQDLKEDYVDVAADFGYVRRVDE